MSLHPPDETLLTLMLADDEAGARASTNDTMVSYITGKRALCHWVRANRQGGGMGWCRNSAQRRRSRIDQDTADEVARRPRRARRRRPADTAGAHRLSRPRGDRAIV
jgi:hypothetical protein